MAFKLTYACEYCGFEVLIYPGNEQGLVCPSCDDTGDTRSNFEKYDCEFCEFREGLGCALVRPYLIEDINCIKEEES